MQGKAISLIHSHAQTVLQKSVATLQAELSAAAAAPAPAEPTASGNATAPPAGPQPAAALLCVRFRALAEPQLAPVLEELAKRTAQAEYQRLLSNIEASFCAERSTLILPFVRQHIAAIQKAEGLHEVARCARCLACPLRAQDMDRCSVHRLTWPPCRFQELRLVDASTVTTCVALLPSPMPQHLYCCGCCLLRS